MGFFFPHHFPKLASLGNQVPKTKRRKPLLLALLALHNELVERCGRLERDVGAEIRRLQPEPPTRRTRLEMKHPCYWRECFQLAGRAGEQPRSSRAHESEGRLIKRHMMETDP